MSEKNKAHYKLCLLEDLIEAGSSSQSVLPPTNRILYQVEGRTKTNQTFLIADNVWFGFGEVNLNSSDRSSKLWRWELIERDQTPVYLNGAGSSSKLLTSEFVDSIEPDENWLLRCDSVAFPLGGCAYTHTHQGPGIRCVVEGEIRIDSQDHSQHFLPGEAWYEAGPEPVFAQASEKSQSRFIRVMLVPPDFEGRSTIKYILAEDQDKPKLQSYRKYCETRLNL